MKVQVTKRGQHIVTIPKAVVELLGLKKGDELIIGMNAERDVTLKKKGG